MHKFGPILITIILLSLITIPVNAQKDNDSDLYTILVTANKVAAAKADTAADVKVISSKDIEEMQAVSLEQILRQSSINMETDSTGTSPILNGDRRVLTLVDGRRMNWNYIIKSGSKGGADFSSIPVENIERIEIVKGAGSSLYGSDAVGGVINIITRNPEQKKITISQDLGSWSFQKSSLTITNKLTEDLGFYLSGELEERDDFEYKEASSGDIKTMDQSYYDQDLWSLKVTKDFQTDNSLQFQFDYSQRDFGFSWTPPGYSLNDTYYYPDGSGDSTAQNLALTYQYGSNNHLRVYKNSYEKDISYDATSGYYVDSSILGGEWQQNWQLNQAHSLLMGIDWLEEDTDYKSQGIDNSYTNRAIFFEDQWQLNQLWTVTGGLRYDDHSIIGNNTTSRITINRKFSPTTNLYFSWGEVVKAPLVEDLFSDTPWMVGNPDLEPETGSTIVVGFNTEFAQGTKLTTSVFNSQLKDAIAYGTSSDGRTLAVNIDKQRKYGLDLSLEKQLSYRWNLAVGYSYLEIENKDGSDNDYHEDLNNNQPNSYHLNLNYQQDLWDAGISLRGAAGRSEQRFSSSSYLTINFAANYYLNNKTRLYLKANNLTNEAYEVRSSGDSGWVYPGAYAMPARNIYLGLEREF